MNRGVCTQDVGKGVTGQRGSKFQAKGALETKEGPQNMNRKKALNSNLNALDFLLDPQPHYPTHPLLLWSTKVRGQGSEPSSVS